MSASWLGVKLGSAAGVARFKPFFRIAVRLDVDKRHLNHRPITKGLQESIQAFRVIDAEIELQPILDFLASRDLREAGSVDIPPRDGKRPDNLKLTSNPDQWLRGDGFT
jgi:Domain of unknown function (DUF1931)